MRFPATAVLGLAAGALLAACTSYHLDNLHGPAPAPAAEILNAARQPDGRGTLALSLRAPAWVTVVEVVPSYSARLLLSGSDSTGSAPEQLGAGRHQLQLRPALDGLVSVTEPSGPSVIAQGRDVLSYDSCLERVMGTTFDQNAPQRAAALDDPYQWCPQRPPEPTAPPKSAPARYVVVVATARAPEPGALRAQLAELNLRQPVDALARELGPRVAASSGEGQETGWSGVSREW
jgi:hypothetical protein